LHSMEIAVISGKGGTGKSSISAAFATTGNSVVIADCDVDAANLYLLFEPVHDDEEVYISGYKAVLDTDRCTNCELCTNYCRFDAITPGEETVNISDISCDGCFLCSRICPENAITMVANDKSRMYSGSFRNGKMVYGWLAPGEENSGKLVNMVREKAKKIAKENGIDNIILDGPPGIGCPVISTITGVDKVIIVTEPTISGLHDLQRATGIVQKSGRNPIVIINKSDLNMSLTEQIHKWCVDNNIRVVGILPFDTKMVESMVRGKSIVEYDPDNRINRKINEILNNILINKL
jgi:MinD superfamily P-loop ATPase